MLGLGGGVVASSAGKAAAKISSKEFIPVTLKGKTCTYNVKVTPDPTTSKLS